MAEKVRSMTVNERGVIVDALRGRVAVLERSKAKESNARIRVLRDEEIAEVNRIALLVQNEEIDL